MTYAMDARFYSIDTLLQQRQGYHYERAWAGIGYEWDNAGALASLRDAIANEENQ